MNTVSLLLHRSYTFTRGKIHLQFPLLLMGWMLITSLTGICIMGLVMDGVLRNLLENKEKELLASRHLALSTAYREGGMPGVERLLGLANFRHDYIHLANREGAVLLEQNPDRIRFTQPLRPMPTLGGGAEVPHWLETTTDRRLDYDLYTGKLPGGVTLRMGLNEQPQEKFFHRSEKLTAQIGIFFLAIGLLGAGALLHRYRRHTVE